MRPKDKARLAAEVADLLKHEWAGTQEGETRALKYEELLQQSTDQSPKRHRG